MGLSAKRPFKKIVDLDFGQYIHLFFFTKSTESSSLQDGYPCNLRAPATL